MALRGCPLLLSPVANCSSVCDSTAKAFLCRQIRTFASRPETRVNSGISGRYAENPRKHWAGGQPIRKRPFYAGFRAGVVAVLWPGSSVAVTVLRTVMLHPGAAIRSGYFWDGSEWLLGRDGGGLFAVADFDDAASFCLTCFEPQKGHFLRSKVLSSCKPYSVRATKILSMNFVRRPSFMRR